MGDVELGVAVGEELQQFFLAGAVEFGGDVVDEDDGRGAAVGGDEPGLCEDERADEGFLLAARVVVRDVAVARVVAQVGAVDAVAGVFEERVAFVVGVEQRGERLSGWPAALVVDVDALIAAQFGVVGVEGVFEFFEVGAAQGVDLCAGFAEDVVPGREVGGAPVLAQRGVAVFQRVVVALPGGEEGGVVVVEAVVEVATAVFGALVDVGEVVAVQDLYRGERGEGGEVFQVLAVQSQAVFARAFFDAEQVFFAVFFDAGDEAEIGRVVGDEVARLVFTEGFPRPNR